MYLVDSQQLAFTGMFRRMPKAIGPSSTSLPAIAERLKLTRIATGMTQAAFCRRVGISVQAWNNYEAGRNRISVDMAVKLLQSIGADLNWIYVGDAARLPTALATEIERLRANPPKRLAG